MSTELTRELYTSDVLANALRLDEGRTLITMSDGAALSVGEVASLTSQYAQAMEQHGVRFGSRFAVLSSNRVEVLLVTNAAQMIGACIVPLHPMGSVADFAYAIEDCEIEHLIFEAGKYDNVVVELKARLSALKGILSFGASDIGVDLVKAAAAKTPARLRPVVSGPSDAVRMVFSGGTTGRPKAIIANQRNTLATMQIIMSEWEWPDPPRMLVCTPLSHAGAACFFPVLLRRGSLVVLPAFEPVAVMQAIEAFRINCIMLVPTMIYALMDHPRSKEFDLSSLETVFYGSSLISPTRLQEAIKRFGPIFFQFYGQSEAPMTVTVMRKGEHDPDNLGRLASCGRPVPWIDAALLDDDCQRVAPGEPGEICVRGPLIMGGYYNRPEETAAVLSGGWLHTGDIAVQDADGFWRIVDRKKDMIVSGGFNVFPREVEDVLSQHPAVAQCAVVGVPDEKWGEAVRAYVVLRQGMSADRGELTGFVKERKGSVQAPKSVVFLDSLPLTALGKPDKKVLKALAAGTPL